MRTLASVLLIAVSAAMVMCSDLFIRARGLDGVHGIDAGSWDVVGTVLLVAGLWGFAVSVFRKDG